MSIFVKLSAQIKIGFFLAILIGYSESVGGRFAYSQFVVFGASFTDTGNVYAATAGQASGPSDRYYLDRWSNGPLWIERVASSYGKSVAPALLGGTNYAHGGAMTCTIASVTSGVPDMCNQVAAYLSSVSNKADSNALYVIDASAVANEITKVIAATVVPAQVTTVAPSNVVNMLQSLYASGARHFLIANLPDMGSTPLVKAYGSSATKTATSLSSQFNAALTIAIVDFFIANPAATLYRIDINGILSKIKYFPYGYGFTNVNDACIDGGVVCAFPDTYIYWDGLHPTELVGFIISSYVLRLI